MSSSSVALVPAKHGAVSAVPTTPHQYHRDADREVVSELGYRNRVRGLSTMKIQLLASTACQWPSRVNLGLNGWITS